MDLDFIRIECDIVSDIPVPMASALYSALRNFEAEFMKSCCPSPEESCPSCGKRAVCPYRIVFEQGLSSDPETVRLHQKPALPFSLYISDIDCNISSCTAGITVVGTAVHFIELFHSALLRTVEAGAGTMLQPAQYSQRCFSLDYHGARHEIPDGGTLSEHVILLSGQHILRNTVHADTATLTLKSPLRISNNGSILHRFDFGTFFRSQLRRCSSLWAYYGTGELDLDYAHLSESADNVAILDNRIQYAQPSWSKRPNRAGLIGTAECAGLVSPMFSLLFLGSFFSAGKGAAFGMGFYQIEHL